MLLPSDGFSPPEKGLELAPRMRNGEKGVENTKKLKEATVEVEEGPDRA